MSDVGSGVRMRSAGRSVFANGATAGVGSLPHADASAAAAFSIGEFDIATIPSTPNRSRSELMLGQAVAGVRGIDVADDGSLVADPSQLRSTGPNLGTDVDGEAFGALRAFLDIADKVHLDGATVKWQFVGPVTLGVALHRAGLERSHAFDLALELVRTRLTDLSAVVSNAMPTSPQMVVLDEPWFARLMESSFPIPPDEAIDRMSGAMAALPSTTLVGVHCCAPCDVATLLASGPRVVSLPASTEILDWVGYLARFLADGGVIAWGVVPTDGPVPSSSERSWRALSDLWCELVQLGCDAVLLRRQSIITPQCGLANHSASVARRIARLTADVGRRVQDQSSATRLALGA